MPMPVVYSSVAPRRRRSALPFRIFCALTLASAAGLLPHSGYAEDLVVPGSGNPEYVLGQLAESFHRKQAVHKVSIPPSTGTAGALRDVEAGNAVLGRVGRPLRAEETRRGLLYVPIGLDAVVFVAGAAVDIRSVTLQQMIDVYSGRITDWKALGANPAPIRAIGREANDASHSVLSRVFPAFEKVVSGKDVKLVHLDPHVYMLLDRFGSSLAFINRSGTRGTKTKVVVLALDGIEPSLENVASGKYRAVLEFGLTHKVNALNEPARAFLEYLRTPEAVQVLRANGIVPLFGKSRT